MGGYEKFKVKTAEEVQKILDNASRKKYEKYVVVKRLKESTDVTVGFGFFSKECTVKTVDMLNVDFRVVGASVVVYDKYVEAQRLKEEEEER